MVVEKFGDTVGEFFHDFYCPQQFGDMSATVQDTVATFRRQFADISPTSRRPCRRSWSFKLQRYFLSPINRRLVSELSSYVPEASGTIRRQCQDFWQLISCSPAKVPSTPLAISWLMGNLWSCIPPEASPVLGSTWAEYWLNYFDFLSFFCETECESNSLHK